MIGATILIMFLSVIVLALVNAIFIIKERKEEKDMAVVYCTLIVKGLKTIDEVPAKIRKQVEELLEALEV